jgi:hypothetical protein
MNRRAIVILISAPLLSTAPGCGGGSASDQARIDVLQRRLMGSQVEGSR